MRDKNGKELKHGDFVRVDFIRLNAPICTCYCQVYNDKLEVIKGKEPSTYYTREITKIGEYLKNPLENVVEMNCQGIKCDNEECGWKDESVTMEQYPEYVDKPCPCCGENLLTREAYKNVAYMKKLTTEANKWIINDIPQKEIDKIRSQNKDISITLPMSANGTIDFGNIEEEMEERE